MRALWFPRATAKHDVLILRSFRKLPQKLREKRFFSRKFCKSGFASKFLGGGVRGGKPP